MSATHRKPLPGTDLDYFDTRAAIEAIQPGAYDKLPYTSRVLAEQLVRRCDPAILTDSLKQLIERKRDLVSDNTIAQATFDQAKAAHDLANPRRDEGHRNEGHGPCRHAAPEPPRREPRLDTLGGREDEGGHEGDHDGREKGAEEDRCKAGGNAHFILLSEVMDGVAEVRLHGAYRKRAARPAA
mgnify:CR=1 FL=1